MLLYDFGDALFDFDFQMTDFGKPLGNLGCSPSVFGTCLYDFRNEIYDFGVLESDVGLWTSKLVRLQTFIAELGQLTLRLLLDTHAIAGLLNDAWHMIGTQPGCAS